MLQNPRTSTDHAVKPAFLITIDTEGDNLWSKPRAITTENSRYISRFQRFCEEFNLKPTYLTSWEMANCPVFHALGRDILARGAGEIGMHLHAWNSPPLIPLTSDDCSHQPYLFEYPEHQIRQKIKVMTDHLEQTFQTKVTSHRAGRWGLNEVYAKALIDFGYRVDCSVTPHISWRSYTGHPDGMGGPDYTHFPETAYFVDPSNIARTGQSLLLEVPVTVTSPYYGKLAFAHQTILRIAGPYSRRLACHFFPAHVRMTPNGRNRKLLLALLLAALHNKRDYAQLTLHSSELMPGGSPAFPSSRSIEDLYDDLNAIFTYARDHFVGLTLTQYHQRLSVAPDPGFSAVGTLP